MVEANRDIHGVTEASLIEGQIALDTDVPELEPFEVDDPNSSIKRGLQDYYYQEYQRLKKMSDGEPDQAFFHFAMGSMLVNLENYPLAIRQYRLFLRKSQKEERLYKGYRPLVERVIADLETKL